MPSFPHPGSVTICEINRDLSTLSLSLSPDHDFWVCCFSYKLLTHRFLQLPQRASQTIEPKTPMPNFLSVFLKPFRLNTLLLPKNFGSLERFFVSQVQSDKQTKT